MATESTDPFPTPQNCWFPPLTHPVAGLSREKNLGRAGKNKKKGVAGRVRGFRGYLIRRPIHIRHEILIRHRVLGTQFSHAFD